MLSESVRLGSRLPLWSMLPFLCLLLSMALIPVYSLRFWSSHYSKFSAFWAVLFAIPFMLVFEDAAVHEILHTIFKDYVPFILLLWTLYVVSGGIYIEGFLKDTPTVNTLTLMAGTILASWIGTTGAAMVLIRPFLRNNAGRSTRVHMVLFFIFLVANIGGVLTPLGDPPLFLGFLHGVPFLWSLSLARILIPLAGVLLILFFLIDCYFYRREQSERTMTGIGKEAFPNLKKISATRPSHGDRLRIKGFSNVILLAVIIAAVILSGTIDLGAIYILGIKTELSSLIRNSVLLTTGLLSLKLTAPAVHIKNHFTWHPIREVATLFAGIFITIIPALEILKAGEAGSLAILIKSVQQPEHYFWATGILSSCLDNTPTYLSFLSLALGQTYPGLPETEAISSLITHHESYLAAISTGAVFMGANTYIGNAPNFMVKSIAEENGVKMPSFFGYILYSAIILIPLFMLITWIFF